MSAWELAALPSYLIGEEERLFHIEIVSAQVVQHIIVAVDVFAADLFQAEIIQGIGLEGLLLIETHVYQRVVHARAVKHWDRGEEHATGTICFLF